MTDRPPDPTRQEKCVAHSWYLLGDYVELRSKYAMLEPILFDRECVQRWGSGSAGWGLQVLRNTLLMSCVLDVYKLTLETDRRAASLLTLVEALEDKSLVADLREAASAIGPIAPVEGDPESTQLIEAHEREVEEQRGKEFDAHVADVRARWKRLRDSKALAGCEEIRHKLIAHTELRPDGDTYRALKVEELGLKYGDLIDVMDQLRLLMELTSHVFRAASFELDEWERQLIDSRDVFWSQAPDEA